ncbi:HEAT repeat domain-containing protein [Pendulispora albinea]|uniref:HEAT repeat domain-containing protein n=1 Tax=Pendulispora albinea TaxID=2741071 RepID=A0ABZ2M9C4_9BACT
MQKSERTIEKLLGELFDAERVVRQTHASLVEHDHGALVAAIAAAVDEAFGLADRNELQLRLTRAAELLSDLEGAQTVDLLIRILGCDEPEPRHAAGEALQEHAYDRFKEVALGVERALERMKPGDPALSELPYLLAEVPEPGVLKLLGRFLVHPDPDAVAAAVEALVEFGDPASVSLLAPLTKDTRTVQLEDETGEEGRITLGELASEARDLLRQIPKSAGPDGGNAGAPGGRPKGR